MATLTGLLQYLAYACVQKLFSVITSIFFREILKRGSHQIPQKGAVIFVAAPHANQFVDPLVIMQTCPRPVRFLMAASSMKKGIPGFFGRLLGCIPVERPMDLAICGPGRITIDLCDRRKVVGIEGTQFLRCFKAEASALAIVIVPETYSSPVERVESDTVLYLKRPLDAAALGHFSATSRGLEYSVLPIIDQSDVYQSVFQVLESGECLGIFPEGGSHDRAEMLPLKAGVTIMALGSMARRPDLDVTIVPCGLNYFNPDKFRSRAMVEFGEPVKIDRKLVELFKLGGESRREACGRLLDQMFYSLCSVTVNVPDYETLQVMQATRRLYQPVSRKLNSFELLEITRRFIKGYVAFKDDPKIKRLLSSILEYNKLLKYFGLYDHQVRTIEISFRRALSLLIIRVSTLILYGIMVLPGIVFNLPAIFIIDYISSRKAARAVAASAVKLKGRDVLATWKMITGGVLFPCLYSLYTFIVATELIKHEVPWHHVLLVCGAIAFAGLPLLSYCSVRVAENGYDCYASIRPLWYSVTRPHYGEVIRNVRYRLKRELIRIVEEYGPKLFGAGFEQSRIVPSRRTSLVDAFEQASSSFSSELLTVGEDAPEASEIANIIEKAESISRSPSPLSRVDDGLDSVISGFQYMRAGVRAVFSSPDIGDELPLTPRIDDWSYVDPVEIDDIFFSSSTTTKTKTA